MFDLRRLEAPVPMVVAIGIVTGFFSALFGVGGGLIVGPALIVFAKYAPRVAMATSLGAIGVTAAVGAVSFSALGDVDWTKAAVIGGPAVVGAVAGTWLQQRISSRVLVAAFAGFVLALAGWFLAG